MGAEQQERQRGRGAAVAVGAAVLLLIVLLLPFVPLLLGQRQQQIGNYVLYSQHGDCRRLCPTRWYLGIVGDGKTVGIDGQLGHYTFGWGVGPVEDWL